MKTLIAPLVLLATAGLALPDLHAQTRAEADALGVAVVLETCPLTSSDLLADDAENRPVEMAPIAAAFLAGIAGDLVAAGANALGGALEEASREQGFNAVADTSFAFYQVALNADDRSVRFAPRAEPAGALCLVAALPADPKARLTAPTATEVGQLGLEGQGIAIWQTRNLPANPAFYMEIALQRREDGFVARPVLIWYRQPFARAPKRALPAELHLGFSIPASADAAATSTFAQSRIRLPAMAPGTVWTYEQLKLYEGPVLPLRPAAGSPDTTRNEFTAAANAVRDGTKEVQQLERSLAHARTAAAIKGASKEDRQKVTDLGDKLEDSKAVLKESTKLLDAAIKRGTVHKGSTNVQVRFTLVRDANKFGLAVAQALQGRSKALGEAVTTDLMPKTRAQAWTEKDTAYVTALSTVAAAQRTLDEAIQKADAAAEFAARLSLKNAKAAANAAAAASDRSLPYPDLL